MAHSNLPVFSHPDFPQTFAAAIDRAVERMLAKPQLGTCWFEDEYTVCRKPATVHHLGTDFEYCAEHFKAVLRG